ncbi:beta family protein [Paenibacillus sp. FSL L8-0463]|uniref:beta family protein n=1 Tax=Paenibacillus sp. FSL L8-0463 TaxID=2954687 RepID=UPI00311A3987
MLDKRHYVPILKWKQGEQTALNLLPKFIKESITPLIELPPIEWNYEKEQPKKTIDKHLNGIGDSIDKHWGKQQAFFIDLLYIKENDRLQNGEHPLQFVLGDLRQKKVVGIPITSVERDVAFQTEIIEANRIDNLGVGIRVREEDFGDLKTKIDHLLAILNIAKCSIDLIVDFEYIDPNTNIRTTLFLKEFLNNIPYLNDWRNIIFCATSFPKDLSEVQRDSIEVIPRSEWIIWKDLIKTENIIRKPVFGDYTIANPSPFEADPRVIKIPASIRYTGDDQFVVFKGKNLRKFGYEQYYDLAAQLVDHEEYKGPTFSAGDQYAYVVASKSDKPGSPTTWRRAGTNHHIVQVATELSNLLLP